MTDHLYDAANNIVPKHQPGDMQRRIEELDKTVKGSWDTPRARLYIAAILLSSERDVKVLGTKIKLLEAIRSER